MPLPSAGCRFVISAFFAMMKRSAKLPRMELYRDDKITDERRRRVFTIIVAMRVGDYHDGLISTGSTGVRRACAPPISRRSSATYAISAPRHHRVL